MSRLDAVSVANSPANTHDLINVSRAIDDDLVSFASRTPTFVGSATSFLDFDLGGDFSVYSFTAKIDFCGTTSPSPLVYWASAGAPTSWHAITYTRTPVGGGTGLHVFTLTGGPVTARYVRVGYSYSGFQCAIKFHEWYADGDAIPTPPDPPPPDPLPAIRVTIEGVEFTGLREQSFRAALNDAGSFFFAINRGDEQATEANLFKGALVQISVPQIHSDVLWEGLLETGDFDLLKTGEEGDEWLHFGGPGSLAILKRAVMDFTQYEGAVTEVFPEKGYWAFTNSAGNRTEGDIIRRIVDEAMDDERPGYPDLIPTITRTFTDDDDTDGTAWEDEAFEGSWHVPIGANVYDQVIRLANGGFVMVEMAPGFVMNAYRNFGRDLTSTSFATDKIRFVKAFNIVEDLSRSMLGASWATRAIVKYEDGTYTRAAIGGTFPHEQEMFVESQATSQLTARREAQGLMRLREDAQEALLVSVLQPLTFQERDWTPGTDGKVKYLPGPEWSDNGQYWIGDTITLHTGSGDFEYDNIDQRIHAVTISIDEDTGELAVPIVELNAPYRRPGQDGDLQSTGGPSASTGDSSGSGSGSGSHVHTAYEVRSDKNQPEGYAGLDEDSLLDPEQVASGTLTDGYVPTVQADGSLAYEAGAGAPTLTAISPSQLVANTDNWNPTGLSTADIIRASTDASRNLTGIVAPAAIKRLILENIGTNPLVLKHDVTSTAGNRFLCPTSVDLTLGANTAVELAYDVTSSRWRVIEPFSPGVTDHGALTGLGDDDHTQYATNTEFDDHSARHESAGADAIKLDDLKAPDDNTDLDATTAAHGLMMKFPGGTSSFLRADGTFADTGDVSSLVSPIPGTLLSGALFGSGTSHAVTVAASAAGTKLLAFVYSHARGANSITQTNVTWTQRYTGNGNSEFLEVWTGVVAGGAAGTTATVAFTGINNQYVEVVAMTDAPTAFTAASAVVTATGTGTTGSMITRTGLVIGSYYFWGMTANQPSSSTQDVTHPWIPTTFTGGQGRGGLFRAQGPGVQVRSVSSSSTTYFAAIIRLT